MMPLIRLQDYASYRRGWAYVDIISGARYCNLIKIRMEVATGSRTFLERVATGALGAHRTYCTFTQTGKMAVSDAVDETENRS